MKKTKKVVTTKVTKTQNTSNQKVNNTNSSDVPSIAIVNGQHIQTFADGSKLNLDTGQVVKNTEFKIAQNSIEQSDYPYQPKIQISLDSNSAYQYLDGVGSIICVDSSGGRMYGSGTIINHPTLGPIVVTNYHVIEGAKGCLLYDKSENDSSQFGIYTLDMNYQHWNDHADAAVLKILSLNAGNIPISGLNYSATSLPSCSTNIHTGSKVVIIGYPAYSMHRYVDNDGTTVLLPQRQVTEGNISGKDGSNSPDGGYYENYYISAKMDSGNSGGLALSQDSSGICTLGIPTWVQVGQYANQGVVQSIHNVVNTK